MKTSVIIFALAIITPLLTLLVLDRMTMADLNANGENAAVVQNKYNFFRDVQQANGPDVEKEIYVGYLEQIHVYGGVQLVHDAAMGDKVKLVGPATAIENLKKGIINERLHLSFNRPITLERPVQFHINLDAHTAGFLRLDFRKEIEQANFVSLITKSPITTQMIQLNGCPITENSIQVENENLILGIRSCDEDRSKVKKLELAGSTDYFNERLSNLDRYETDQFSSNKLVLHSIAPSGESVKIQADSINLTYDFRDRDDNYVYDTANLVPDTLIINSDAILTVKRTLKTFETIDDSSLVHTIRQ